MLGLPWKKDPEREIRAELMQDAHRYFYKYSEYLTSGMVKDTLDGLVITISFSQVERERR